MLVFLVEILRVTTFGLELALGPTSLTTAATVTILITKFLSLWLKQDEPFRSPYRQGLAV